LQAAGSPPRQASNQSLHLLVLRRSVLGTFLSSSFLL
jgi:hypothetical protein